MLTSEDRVTWRLEMWCSEHEDFLEDFAVAAERYEDYHEASIIDDVDAIRKLFDFAGLDDLPFSAEDFAEYIEERI